MAAERPLDGLRVLDLSRLLPGPYATMVLGDLGARVDKIEDPSAGDYLRLMPPHKGGMNALFHTLNRGKRSLILDLKRVEGQTALLRLLPRYDVLVESFRPGVMARLNLGVERLRTVHPGLVYCAITGYGQDGPLAHRAGHDLNYLARAGVLGFTGPSDGPPQVPGVQMADIGGGALFAVVGILAALASRARSGIGGFVDISMCEGALALAAVGFGTTEAGHDARGGSDVLSGGIAPYNTYRAKDGKYVALGALEPKFWTSFCEGVGLTPSMEAMMPGPHQIEWKNRVAEKIATRTRDEWAAFGAERDCCIEPVLEPGEVFLDTQHRHRGVFAETTLPDGASIRQLSTPAARGAVAGAGPGHGAHTDEVLGEGGFTPSEIDALRAAGATR